MVVVSIVVPIYKVEPWLRECLDSVLAQTFTNWECICVDDGSPDKCGEICDEYAKRDSRFRVIHKTNGGLSSARNAGMDAAKGTYLYFLDSDDMIATDTLERLVKAAEKEHLDQIVFGAEVFADSTHATETDLSVKSKYYSIPPDLCGQVWSGPRLFKSLVAHRALFVSVPLRFFRRSALPKSLRFPEGVIHEDNYFSPLALIWAKRAAILPVSLYRRRIRPYSIMTSPEYDQRHKKAYCDVWTRLRKSPLRPGWFNEARKPYILFLSDIYRMCDFQSTSRWERLVDRWHRYGWRGVMRMVKASFSYRLRRHHVF